jgi:hypothetical protein
MFVLCDESVSRVWAGCGLRPVSALGRGEARVPWWPSRAAAC